jgi:3-oxoacyl-[acyl-carrier-protein] synthase II
LENDEITPEGLFKDLGEEMNRRVVVTGLGIISPIGLGIGQFWKAALEGRSGITALRGFDGMPLEAYRSRVVGQILDFEPRLFMDAALADRSDRAAQFALAAAKEAIADSGLSSDEEDPYRVGVIVGAGMGAMAMGEPEFVKLYESRKPQRVHPSFIPTITLNSISGILSIAHGAKGPNLTISTACSSSAHAIGQGLASIRTGQADVIITVGAEASITPLAFAGFCSLRVLSTRFNDTPAQASRPFDQARDGFVMGEGAGALILESLVHARRRRARIYAEVAGYAGTSEAYHMVIPREDGSEEATTMELAMHDAHVASDQVDYINAHGTSTPIGDVVEIRAIRRVFKAHADRLLLNATKSMIGHTLGAAGAIGSLASVLTLESGFLHPTVNYDDPDPACQLPGISPGVQERQVNVALVNAFGFGSNNATVVLKKYK